MSHTYRFTHQVASFSKPLRSQVPGGAHLTFEITPVYRGKAIALKRHSIPGHEAPPAHKDFPGGMYFFCHDLIRYKEDMDAFVSRIVREQAGVRVTTWKIVDFESFYQPRDKQWALLGYIIAEVASIPKVGRRGNDILGVSVFSSFDVPRPFGWWTQAQVRDYVRKHVE